MLTAGIRRSLGGGLFLRFERANGKEIKRLKDGRMNRYRGDLQHARPLKGSTDLDFGGATNVLAGAVQEIQEISILNTFSNV